MSATLVPVLLGCAVSLAVMAGLLVPLEGWFPISASRLRPRAAATCVAFFVGNTVLMQLLGSPVLEAVESAFAPSAPPSWPRWVAVLVLADVAGYWAHRAMHRVPWLWRLHAVHHAPTELNWLDAWRQHPVDFVMHGLAVGLPGALLGASLADMASVVLVRKVITAFLHANVRWRLLPLQWVLATPLFHRVHHSADPRDYDSNFAGTFAFVDLLFGTHRRASGFPAAVGLVPVAAGAAERPASEQVEPNAVTAG